jgi:hypothetical protein
MANGHDRTAEYREKARELRDKAVSVLDRASRQEMLEVAVVLERWADGKDGGVAERTKSGATQNRPKSNRSA